MSDEEELVLSLRCLLSVLLSGGRLSIGACSVGAAQVCLEIAIKYVKVR